MITTSNYRTSVVFDASDESDPRRWFSPVFESRADDYDAALDSAVAHRFADDRRSAGRESRYDG